VERVERLIAQVAHLADLARSLARGERGLVSIACYPVHVERFLASVIRDYARGHPEVRLDLTKLRDDRRRNIGRSLFEELRDHEIDLAVGPPHTSLGFSGLRLYDAQIVLVVPDGHPLRHSREVSVTALHERPLLIAPTGFFSRQTTEAACFAAGVRTRVAVESASPSALFALARAGQGDAVLPDDYSIIGSASPAYPVLVDGDGVELSTPVWLQWRDGEELPPAVTSFVECARHWATVEGGEPRAAAFT
jgi:DNA-binding transcriptional LysR family regulator